MPTSTLLQLVARGRQDAYLTSNPQFTFFKHVYRRYTPFAMESIPIEFDGTPNFGQRISVVIPRKAELLSSLFLEVELPPIPQPDPLNPSLYWVNDIGHALIQDVSIEIGEKEIDKQTGEWLHIWEELTTSADKRSGYNEMVGHWDVYPPLSLDVTQSQRLTVPLRFWFCNTIGEALPLIALQAHPVRIIIHLRPLNDLVWSSALNPLTNCCPNVDPLAITRMQMYGDYIFLDKEERQKFAAADHEYLITQLQYTPQESVPAGAQYANVKLHFNNPCTEFIWTVQQDRMRCVREWFNYGNVIKSLPLIDVGKYDADLLDSAILRLDGYDRFQRRNAQYFRLTQPYQFHKCVPDTPGTYIYLYSFSLRPEDEQPAGSINCSKIDDITLSLRFNPNELTSERFITVYTRNYNVLRIVGGLGGLAFIA